MKETFIPEPGDKDVKYKSTLKNVVQDEDHIQFDFELTPIDVPPKNNEKDSRIAQLENEIAQHENEIAQLEARFSILEDQIQQAMAVANQAQMTAEAAFNR